MIERTKNYLKFLYEQKKRIMIPAPVVGEFLVKFNDTERNDLIQVIEKSFYVPSFDIRAAGLAAELTGNQSIISEIKETTDINKACLKVDAMIVAIAILHNAEMIVTNDPHLAKLAQGRIQVNQVPVIPDQPLLFE